MRKPFYRLKVELKHGRTFYYVNGEIETAYDFLVVMTNDEENTEVAFNLNDILYFKISPIVSLVK